MKLTLQWSWTIVLVIGSFAWLLCLDLVLGICAWLLCLDLVLGSCTWILYLDLVFIALEADAIEIYCLRRQRYLLGANSKFLSGHLVIVVIGACWRLAVLQWLNWLCPHTLRHLVDANCPEIDYTIPVPASAVAEEFHLPVVLVAPFCCLSSVRIIKC